MPYFTPDDLDIDPSEYIDSCSSREIQRLVEILIEDGHVNPKELNNTYGVSRPNINDDIFWESLEYLKKCRDLLSPTEESFINNLAERFKHLR
jgi:hypothetical protein